MQSVLRINDTARQPDKCYRAFQVLSSCAFGKVVDWRDRLGHRGDSILVSPSLTSPCHEQKSLIYGLAALMHLLHFPARRDPSRRLGKEFQQSQFTENGVKVFGNAGDLDFQTFTFHLQTPQSDRL